MERYDSQEAERAEATREVGGEAIIKATTEKDNQDPVEEAWKQVGITSLEDRMLGDVAIECRALKHTKPCSFGESLVSEKHSQASVDCHGELRLCFPWLQLNREVS